MEYSHTHTCKGLRTRQVGRSHPITAPRWHMVWHCKCSSCYVRIEFSMCASCRTRALINHERMNGGGTAAAAVPFSSELSKVGRGATRCRIHSLCHSNSHRHPSNCEKKKNLPHIPIWRALQLIVTTQGTGPYYPISRTADTATQ